MSRVARAAALLLVLAVPARAAAAPPPHESWTATVRFENDLMAGTDQHYTNGVKVSMVSPDLQWFQDLPFLKKDTPFSRVTNRLIDWMPFTGDETRQRNVSLSIGQQMFTPEDIQRTDLIVDDRPYAGWLYGGMAFHLKTYRVLDTFELQAGFTGPWSLAEEAQNLVHDVRGIKRARGWDNQIDTEFAFAVIYDRKYRLIPRIDFGAKWGGDLMVHAGGALGTAFSHAAAGFEARFGWNVPTDFGTAVIRPAGETNMPSDTGDPRYEEEGYGFSFHISAAAAGRAVLNDIFLDGNTFEDSHNVDKHPLVGDFVLGANLIWGRWKVSYAHVLRTKEFEGQDDGQQFGSISLSYTF